MTPNYDPQSIEPKWQEYWQDNGVYKVTEDTARPKYYCLDMFPYPSGAGLHVGHPRGYVASDVFSRFKRMQGFNVLHPMGFDSFGLPAEQYAIKTGNNPGPFTEELIQTFKSQLSMIGMSYDWSREIATHRPDFYRWTQWIFLHLYNHYYDIQADKALPITQLVQQFQIAGSASVSAACSHRPTFSTDDWNTMSELEQQGILMNYRLAYEGYAEVNWCAELGTVLANDEVKTDSDGNLISERGDYPVTKKSMRQWFMRITAYADRLLSGLESLDWSESIKTTQRNWIGKQTGVLFSLQVKGSEKIVQTYSTHFDAFYADTFAVIAADHAMLAELLSGHPDKDTLLQHADSVAAKRNSYAYKTTQEHEGFFTGIYLEDPITGRDLPLWVSSYALANYGTGIIKCSAHDSRDFAFAKKYGLPLVAVMFPKEAPAEEKSAIQNFDYCYDGFESSVLELPQSLAGMSPQQDHERIRQYLIDNNYAVSSVQYKMRDAIFARQRYWGEPIPLIHNTDGTITEMDADQLPLVLPELEQYAPTETGEPPLARNSTWLDAGYETNTMPGWAGSSWYWLRYMDPKNTTALAGQDAIEYWQRVDMYVGGTEHATGHLLYSRFWNKFLYDIGVAPTEEPFAALRNQGMILAADGRKMSKRWGNTVTPDEMIERFGADTFRLYQCFIGPFDASQPWIIDGLVGCRRFLERVWRIAYRARTEGVQSSEIARKSLHRTIKKVGEDIVDFKFNTAVAALMECINVLDREVLSVEDIRSLLVILAPFAPHMTEELYSVMGSSDSIHRASWPEYSADVLTDNTVVIAVSVNGKPRGELEIPLDATEEEVIQLALSTDAYTRWVVGKSITKTIFVPNKIINFIVTD